MTAGQYDEELIAAGNEMVLLKAQLAPTEHFEVTRRTDELHLGYLYLSSDEAHLLRAQKWNEQARKFIAERDGAAKIEHAADVMPPLQTTARGVLDAIGYDDPTLDPESYAATHPTSGGVGGDSPQPVEKPVDNRYVLLILTTDDAKLLADAAIDSGGSAEYDLAERFHRLIARAKGE